MKWYSFLIYLFLNNKKRWYRGKKSRSPSPSPSASQLLLLLLSRAPFVVAVLVPTTAFFDRRKFHFLFSFWSSKPFSGEIKVTNLKRVTVKTIGEEAIFRGILIEQFQRENVAIIPGRSNPITESKNFISEFNSCIEEFQTFSEQKKKYRSPCMFS